MVNIVAEYRLDYTGNNRALAEGEAYDFANFADPVGLGDDGRLYLLSGDAPIEIPAATEGQHNFTYTNINCDRHPLADTVITRADLAKRKGNPLFFEAGSPQDAAQAVQTAADKGKAELRHTNPETGTKTWKFDVNGDAHKDDCVTHTNGERASYQIKGRRPH